MLRCAQLVLLLSLLASVAYAGEPALETKPADGASADPKALEFFENKVRPLLVERCLECHGAEKQKGNLRLDSLAAILKGGDSGPALVAGKPEASRLVQAIGYTSDIKMPPKSKLPEREIADLTQWVKLGAPWPNAKPNGDPVTKPAGKGITAEQRAFWTFQPVVEPAVPAVRQLEWVKSPLDRFILARLEAAGLEPAPAANKLTLIRRATFDLTGLPPTIDDVNAFLADQSDNAFARIVDRLLASPRYGERWGRHWLDVARFADSNGLDENLAYANAYRYRDNVIDAFNRDKPFSRFVQEQIAGDLLSPESPDRPFEGLIATGFLCLGAKMLAEDDPVKMQMDIIDEQVDTFGRTFLGLTLGCARCHDHKFDPIPTDDYYALAGIFKSTKTMTSFSVVASWQERPLANPEELHAQQEHQRKISDKQGEVNRLVDKSNKQLLDDARAHAGDYFAAAVQQQDAAGKPLVAPASPADGYRLKSDIVEQWSQALEQPAAEVNSPFAVWHAWRKESQLPAADSSPLAARFADLEPTSSAAIVARYAKLFAEADEAWKKLLAGAVQPATAIDDPALEPLRKLLYDPKGPLAIPKNSEKFYPADEQAQLAALQNEVKALQQTLPKLPETMAVSEDTTENLRVHLRGSHLTLGGSVARRFPRVFSADEPAALDSEGSGRRQLADWLVRPEHPLTSRVMVNRVWHWHFGEGLVRSPDNFGTLGERPTHPELLDWLARRFVEQGWSLKALHRLIMLSSTYQMNTAMNSRAAQADPENRLWWRMNRRRHEAEALRDGLLAACGTLDLTMGGTMVPTKNHDYVTGTGSNLPPNLYNSQRRSIYLPVVRSALYDVFQSFDFADPSVMNGRRDTTTVAPQALFMMNSQLVAQGTRSWALRLLQDPPADDAARVEAIYQQAYSRPATASEAGRALQFVNHYRKAEMTRQTPAEEARLRAWQSLCRAVLSANEFVYIE